MIFVLRRGHFHNQVNSHESFHVGTKPGMGSSFQPKPCITLYLMLLLIQFMLFFSLVLVKTLNQDLEF